MADDPLRRLHDQTRYSENIQAAMRVPSCISLQEQEFETCAEKADENQILLQTPPDTLRLDDSNYWVDNRLESSPKYEKVAPLPQKTSLNYSNISETYPFDEMSDLQKLRNQMFKVNRRLTKIERLNRDLDQTARYALYTAVAALSFSLVAAILRK